jgi:hypothetical protein
MGCLCLHVVSDGESGQQRAFHFQLQCSNRMQCNTMQCNASQYSNAANIATALFAETLDNFQHSTPFIPESRSCTLNSSRQNLRTRISILYFKGPGSNLVPEAGYLFLLLPTSFPFYTKRWRPAWVGTNLIPIMVLITTSFSWNCSETAVLCTHAYDIATSIITIRSGTGAIFRWFSTINCSKMACKSPTVYQRENWTDWGRTGYRKCVYCVRGGTWHTQMTCSSIKPCRLFACITPHLTTALCNQYW